MAMDPWRFVTLYVGFSTIMIFFGLMGIKIIKRDPKDKVNQFLSSFYFIEAIAIVINMIYALISNPMLQNLVNLLSTFAVFLLNFALGFLILFTIFLYNPGKMIKSKNQFLFLIIYGGILSIIFIIPNGIEIKILSDGTQLPPVWNLPFTLYVGIFTASSGIHTLYSANKIYKNFNHKELAKKFKYFIFGVFIFYFFYCEGMVFNYLNSSFLRQFFAISLILIIVGAYAIYYGIGLQPKAPIDLKISVEEEQLFRTKKF